MAIMTFAAAGFAAGLAASVATSRVSMGQAPAGTGLELEAIAAVILGNNGFHILNVDPFYRDLTTGLIILAAIGIRASGKRGR